MSDKNIPDGFELNSSVVRKICNEHLSDRFGANDEFGLYVTENISWNNISDELRNTIKQNILVALRKKTNKRTPFMDISTGKLGNEDDYLSTGILLPDCVRISDLVDCLLNKKPVSMFAGIDIKGLSDAEKDAEWEKTKANDPDAREFEKAAIAFFHSGKK